MTKAGIEHNLKKSPYYTTVNYTDGRVMMFYFSSQNAKNKFDEGRFNHAAQLRESLTARFKMQIIVSNMFADVDFYRRIERRGFYIVKGGHEMKYSSAFSFELV